MKKYRLLRNNKETGPYTADQLVTMGLKAYDLVWLDGRSAAWRYPCEMDEFKPYVPAVEEQPFDRFFKKPSSPQKTTLVETPPAQNRAAEPPKTKPRFRVKADWNQLGQPTRQHVPTSVQAAEALPQAAAVPNQTLADRSWESQWLDWNREKTAVQEASRSNTTIPQNPLLPGDTGVAMETTFTQSLDSIKQLYKNTVLKAKSQAPKNRPRLATVALAVAAAIGVSAVVIWLGDNRHSDATTEKNVVPANIGNMAAVKATPQPLKTTTSSGTPVDNTANATPRPNQDAKEVIPDFEDGTATAPQPEKPLAAAPKKTPYQPTSQPKPKAPQQSHPVVKRTPAPLTAKQSPAIAKQQAYRFTPALPATPGTRNKTVNAALTPARPQATTDNKTPASQNRQQAAPQAPTGAEPATPIFTHYKKQQKVDDFVLVEAEQPFGSIAQNMALNVQNVTDASIDLVVIDVQYYDANGKLKNGQTMYVKNIPEDETVRVKIPDSSTTGRVKYKVSLVSVEQKGVYLVAE